MEYSFYDFLKLLGSLALFLYGMKIMSEGLQKFAGDRLRKILTAMTTNRVTGVLTGVLITALVQSSSATTVMVVSFVNAGLLTLSQSIGVIMGANIGTTVTAWIISALGFKVDIAAFALPLLAFGIPLLFSQKSNRKSVGEFIFGFSFLFMGLSYLKNNAPDLSQNPDMLSFVQDYTDMGFISILLFVGIGGHNSRGRIGAALRSGRQLCGSGGDSPGKGVNDHRLADHAGRRGQDILCVDVQRLAHQLTALLGQRHAVGGAGVSVAAVDHDGLCIAVGQVSAIHLDGCAADLVGGVDTGCGAADVGLDECQIVFFTVIRPDAAMDTGRCKTLGRADAALN